VPKNPADFLECAVAAFVAATEEQREAAVALERYRIGAYLRDLGFGKIAREVEHGDHIDGDQPPIPSLRLVMAAREEFMRRADAAEAEVKRLRDLVRRAFVDGYNWSCDGPRDDVRKAWSESIACHEVSRG